MQLPLVDFGVYKLCTGKKIKKISHYVILEFQAATLKRYPAQLSLTTWMCVVGAAQSTVFTAIITEHKPSAWAIGLNIDLWSTLYGVSMIVQHGL